VGGIKEITKIQDTITKQISIINNQNCHSRPDRESSNESNLINCLQEMNPRFRERSKKESRLWNFPMIDSPDFIGGMTND
jgi:hypothetical protein